MICISQGTEAAPRAIERVFRRESKYLLPRPSHLSNLPLLLLHACRGSCGVFYNSSLSSFLPPFHLPAAIFAGPCCCFCALLNYGVSGLWQAVLLALPKLSETLLLAPASSLAPVAPSAALSESLLRLGVGSVIQLGLRRPSSLLQPYFSLHLRPTTTVTELTSSTLTQYVR